MLVSDSFREGTWVVSAFLKTNLLNQPGESVVLPDSVTWSQAPWTQPRGHPEAAQVSSNLISSKLVSWMSVSVWREGVVYPLENYRMSPENHWLEDVFPVEIAPF